MRKHVVLWVLGITLYYVLLHVSPAVALLSMAVVITSPMMKYSWRSAIEEDRRVKLRYEK